jgi:hypothetical protein
VGDALSDGVGDEVPLTLVTNVIALRAGSVTVTEPFAMVSALWGATFLLASVSQFATVPDAMVFARVNCWLTEELFLLTATMTTVLPLLYAETKTFAAGFAVASIRTYPGRTNRAKCAIMAPRLLI